MTGDECRAAGTKQWCVNGHDTYECGRTPWRGCRECQREAQRRYKASDKGREANRRYGASDKGREAKREATRRYVASALGLVTRRIYEQSKRRMANNEQED